VIGGRSWAAALLPVLAVGAIGCGGDDGGGGAAAKVPDGWKVTEQPTFSFAHPADWKITTRASKTSARGDEQVTEASFPGQPAGISVVIGATKKFGTRFDDLVALNAADTATNMPQAKKLEMTAPKVSGAERTQLVEYEIPVNAPLGSTSVATRAYDLIALTKSGDALNLFARVPAGQADSAKTIREIVATLRLK
jgi:hypothetical protein